MAIDAGTIYSSIRLDLDKIQADIKTIKGDFTTFAKTNQAQAGVVEKRWTDSFKKFSLAGVAAFAGIGLVIKGAIGTFSSFEQSLANVQSVAKGTAEEFEQIEDAAREAGETTKFTATEAANALYSLASAGLDAAEATAALDGVLQLAGATQSDLAFTSATVAAALSQFGLEAKEATDVSNIFAAAIGNSQANMTKLANAMRQVGPVAGALGISLEKTVGSLQALFDAGFQGEQAGTALRNILSSLANQADPTVKKLNALGIAFEDLNPAVNSMADIVGVLNEANLDAGQIIAAFGREAGPALLSLLEVGKSGIEDYTAAVTDTTAAADAYAIQMNTLEGSMAEMRSAVESVAISFVKEFAPAIRVVIDGVTKIIRGISSLPGPLKIFFGIFAVGIPVITGLGIAFATLGTIISASMLPIVAVVGAVAALTAGGIALNRIYNKTAYATDDLNKAHKNLKTSTNVLKESIEKYKTANEELKKSNEELSDSELILLEGRRKLAGLELAANMQNTIKSLTELEKKSKSNSAAIIKYTSDLERLETELKVNNEEVERLTELQANGVKWFSSYGGGAARVSTYLGYTKAALEGNIKSIQGTTTALAKAELAEGKANLERQEAIDNFANLVNLEIIQLSQIELYNKGIAEQVALRAAQIKEESKLAEERENLAGIDDGGISGLDPGISEEQQRIIDANDKLTESIKKSREELEELGKTEIEILNIQRARRNAEIAASGSSAELIREAIAANNEYIDAKIDLIRTEEEEQELNDKITATIERHKKAREQATVATDQAKDQTADYELQLLRLVGSEKEVIEAERQRAIATAMAALESGASVDAVEAQIIAINNLYDKIAEGADEGLSNWLDANKKYIDAALGAFNNFVGSLDSLFKASADNQISEIERTLEAELSAINMRMEKELEAAGLTEETKLESLQRKLDAAIAAGDEETSIQLQKEIDRLQITEKYESEKVAAKEDAERKAAQIEYKAAIASWKIKIITAIADAAASIIGIWAQYGANPAVAGILTGASLLATGVQLAAIKKAKPQAPGFQTGGIVLPAGAAGRQVTVAENGAPELLLNGGGEGAALLDQFAERIVRAMGTRGAGSVPIIIWMDVDGRRLAEVSAVYYNNGNVPLRIKL